MKEWFVDYKGPVSVEANDGTIWVAGSVFDIGNDEIMLQNVLELPLRKGVKPTRMVYVSGVTTIVTITLEEYNSVLERVT